MKWYSFPSSKFRRWCDWIEEEAEERVCSGGKRRLGCNLPFTAKTFPNPVRIEVMALWKSWGDNPSTVVRDHVHVPVALTVCKLEAHRARVRVLQVIVREWFE